MRGVTPDDIFDFVLDPAQYTKADTKMVWVTKLADTPDGMLAREDGRFLGRFPGSVITRYKWDRPHSIDVVLEHGVPERLHAWFEIERRRAGPRCATSRSCTWATDSSVGCMTASPAGGSPIGAGGGGRGRAAARGRRARRPLIRPARRV